jgi:hypothetical protein
VARAKKLSKMHQFKVSVPQQTYDYLTLLATRGKIAATVPDVAGYILVNATESQLSEGYHDGVVPKP